MSGLVERVARAIDPEGWAVIDTCKGGPDCWRCDREKAGSTPKARAAIKAVAEWAEKQGHEGEADYLITLLRLELKEGSE